MPVTATADEFLQISQILRTDNAYLDQEEVEGLQWGKPGPGGAYWRNSALTGQNFFDKMVTLHAIVRINEFSF